ncbi:type I-C CRISPR-associated protein Cas8c/Csd1 [Moraxella osloensis]|uniref:Type I-C CRISPR-associated protein Cas8c/Csd1 n=1 Tax=Faucicola osloensis TaxID=34062 RepID=A0AA91FJ94_FAUOS|nr:type I-C CRISPR-associated protein Cas8c/Csd1 [Moraxella osloensis]OBX64900.1 type I-C CRISPR-associated protein Cas8c/Csd1 [Moraxella osloensis]
MSWLSRLYHTYEQVKDNADAQLHYALMPYYHVKQNVQIIVTINDKGDFVSARLARDGNGKLKSQVTTIPATNDSATRTSSPVAHPLADKLQYVAKDFFIKSKNKKDVFDLFEKTLTDWCQSPFSHPKAQAVLRYTQKGTLTQDLINAGIILADETGNILYVKNASDYPDSILALLVKNGGEFDQGSAFVAWEVINADIAQGDITTWKDDSLFTAWQNYYASFDSKEGFCHVTGEHKALASKHPNRVLKSASNAKLISANDMSGFTFLGRFTDDDKSIAKQGYQAVNISAEVTEKAHAALAWLLTSQGHEDSGQAVVAWAIDGSKIPQPYKPIVPQAVIEDTWSDFDSEEFADIDDSDEIEEQSSKLHHHKDIGSQFAHSLKKTMQGYRQKLTDNDQISVISLDSATPGRMAVTYYYEAMPDEYLNAMEDWYDNFAWYAFYFDKETNQKHMTIQAPTPYQIAVSAYGLRLSDTVKKQVVSQVLPVIVEGHHRQIPRTLMDLCVKRACNPLGLENWEWEQNLSVACSLYRGYYNRLKNDKKRSYTVALQENYTSRDYLYGRLLAIAEDIESLALYVAGENRVTTAQRYMQQFANRPFSTWRNIELSLDPYMKRLKNNRPDYLFNKQNLLNDVMSKFDINDFNNDGQLSGEFLLGYHCQKMAFYLTKTAKKTDEKTNIETQADA